MLVFLLRKVAIPKNHQINCVSWNHKKDWIACGCKDGTLKLLLFETDDTGINKLKLNQTFSEHTTSIEYISWNQILENFITVDSNNTIILWNFHHKYWYSEILDEKQEKIYDLKWDYEGKRFAILYSDMIIVFNTELIRLWEVECRQKLLCFTWKYDNKSIIFCTKKGLVQVYQSGSIIREFQLKFKEIFDNSILGIQWIYASDRYTLVFTSPNGKVQFMKSEFDNNPLIVDIGIHIKDFQFNPQGTIIAFLGTLKKSSDNNENNVILFYTNRGKFAQRITFTGYNCGEISWNSNGTRIAVAVDNIIYIAAICFSQKFCFLDDTLVFVNHKNSSACVTFYNTKLSENFSKEISDVCQIKSCSDVCAIINRTEDQRGKFCIYINNSIGHLLDTAYTDIEPLSVSMNNYLIFICSRELVFMWQFRASDDVNRLDLIKLKHQKAFQKLVFHIDDITLTNIGDKYNTNQNTSQDCITSCTTSNDYLFISKENGLIHIFEINPLKLVAKYSIKFTIQNMYVNCDTSMLTIISMDNELRILKIDKSTFSVITKSAQFEVFERNNVWDFIWATDDSSSFALMEKSKLYIFKYMEPEEPITMVANLCEFNNLVVKTCILEKLLTVNETLPDVLSLHEVKSLKYVKNLIKNVSLKEAFLFAEAHPHVKLWETVIEGALLQTNFSMAEEAAIYANNYSAIQFIKRLNDIDGEQKQKAEILAYYHRFDEAEKVLINMDRKDLAIDMRVRLGDWFKVLKLAQEGGVDHILLTTTWENIGDHYAEKKKWSTAIEYYQLSKSYKKLSFAYYITEDYAKMEELIEQCTYKKRFICLFRKSISICWLNRSCNTFLY